MLFVAGRCGHAAYSTRPIAEPHIPRIVWKASLSPDPRCENFSRRCPLDRLPPPPAPASNGRHIRRRVRPRAPWRSAIGSARKIVVLQGARELEVARVCRRVGREHGREREEVKVARFSIRRCAGQREHGRHSTLSHELTGGAKSREAELRPTTGTSRSASSIRTKTPRDSSDLQAQCSSRGMDTGGT